MPVKFDDGLSEMICHFRKMECPLGSFQSKSFVPLGASLEQRLEKRQRVKYSEAPPLVTRLNDLSINARMATAR